MLMWILCVDFSFYTGTELGSLGVTSHVNTCVPLMRPGTAAWNATNSLLASNRKFSLLFRVFRTLLDHSKSRIENKKTHGHVGKYSKKLMLLSNDQYQTRICHHDSYAVNQSNVNLMPQLCPPSPDPCLEQASFINLSTHKTQDKTNHCTSSLSHAVNVQNTK